MTHDPRLEQVLAAILTGAPNPLDDDREPDYEPDGYAQWQIDQRGDEAADRDYDRRTR